MMNLLTADDPETRSTDLVADNVAQLKVLFPEAFTEDKIDFEVLRQLLGDAIDNGEEKYGLNWHGKRRARRLALTPSTGTLRPCPDDSVDWDTTQNLMIEGDNLEVLKLLQKSYAGRVKLIYIDPPYNTGNDFVYPDDYRDGIKNYLEITGQVDVNGQMLSSNPEASGRFHTNWLNMMYPRLKMARNLLAHDGMLMVSTDDKELQNARNLCDSIFGEESFVGTLTWITTTQPDNTGRARFGLQQNVEYVFVYSKCPRLELPPFKLEHSGRAPRYPHTGKFGPCRFEIIERASAGGYTRPTMQFRILGQLPREGKRWQIGEQQARELEERDRLEIVDGMVKKVVYPEDEVDSDRGLIPFWAHLKETGTSQHGKSALTELLGANHGIDTVKPIGLVAEILKHFPNDALVLDFFAGSGTTAHSIWEANRKDGGSRSCVMVQIPLGVSLEVPGQRSTAQFCDSIGRPRTLAEITKERLRRTGKKIKEENPDYDGDVGFRVFKLDSSNIKTWEPDPDDLEQSLLDHVDNIKAGRNEQDILYEVLLKLGLDLCAPIESRDFAGKQVSAVSDGALFACLAERINGDDVEELAEGIADWRDALENTDNTTAVFRDSAFVDDVAKTNCTEILRQRGISNVRSI